MPRTHPNVSKCSGADEDPFVEETPITASLESIQKAPNLLSSLSLPIPLTDHSPSPIEKFLEESVQLEENSQNKQLLPASGPCCLQTPGSIGNKKVDEIIEYVRQNLEEVNKALATLGENFEHDLKVEPQIQLECRKTVSTARRRKRRGILKKSGSLSSSFTIFVADFTEFKKRALKGINLSREQIRVERSKYSQRTYCGKIHKQWMLTKIVRANKIECNEEVRWSNERTSRVRKRMLLRHLSSLNVEVLRILRCQYLVVPCALYLATASPKTYCSYPDKSTKRHPRSATATVSSAKEHTERHIKLIVQQNDLPPVLTALSTEAGNPRTTA